MTAKLKQFIEHRNDLITLNEDLINDIIPYKIATQALIFDFLTSEEPNAILNRYFNLFDSSLSSGNITELGKHLNHITAEINNQIYALSSKYDDVTA